MKIFKFGLVICVFTLSLSLMAEENVCPEGQMWIPYHDSCMTLPPVPTCPEGETWIPYHNSCMAAATETDDTSL